jgi:biopolymer transport protein ExbD
MNVPRARESVRSEINVTPLVDVCLVLLIIFMVVTPMLHREINVQLPETGSPGAMPQATRQLRITIREDGTVRVDDTAVPLSELSAILGRLRAAGPERPVIVEGDRRLRYEQISRVLESVEDAGFRKVGLITVRTGRRQG